MPPWSRIPAFSVEILTEYTGLSEQTDAVYLQKLIDLYSYKYSGQTIDLIISVDMSATNFILAHGETLFPGVPVVLLSGKKDLKNTNLKSNMTGLLTEIDVKGTLNLALKLHPGTRHIAVISGSSEVDPPL